MAEFREIRRFLDAVRRRIGLSSVLEGLAFVLVGLLTLGTAMILGAWVGAGTGLEALRLGGAIAGGVLVLGSLGWFAVRPWVRFRRPDDIARFVERRDPSLKGGVLSCVELERGAANPGPEADLTAGLVSALAQQTALRVRSIRAGRLVSWRGAARMGQLLVALVVLLGAAVTIAPEPFSEGLQTLRFGVRAVAAAPYARRVEERDVVVGLVQYTLVFPAYTQLPNRTMRNTAGDVSALVGTTVVLRTRSLVPVAEARLVFDEDHDHPLPLTVSGDGEIGGEWTVRRDGRFRFEIVRPDGVTALERTDRKVKADPDKAPDIQLLAPTEDLTVRTDDPVQLTFSAADDYGLAGVDIVTLRGDDGPARPVRRRAAALSGTRSHVGGVALDLRELNLAPGESADVWLEAYDNNTVAEQPQRTPSRKVRIKRYSPEERHDENVDAQRQLLDRMLNVLADRLESPIEHQKPTRYERSVDTQAGIVKATGALLEDLRRLLAGLEDDPLASDDVRAELQEMLARHEELNQSEQHHVKAALAETRSSSRPQHLAVLFRTNEAGVLQLEKDVALLADLVDRQHVRQLVAQARDLVAAQRELSELIQKLKKADDPALRLAIQQRIAKLMRRIEKLMAQMRKNARQVPHENVNMDALHPDRQMSELREMRSRLGKMQELMRQGKVDEAIRMAEQMERSLQELVGQLEAEAQQLGASSQPESKTRRKLGGEISKLIHRQDAVHRGVKDVDQAYKRRLGEKVRRELAPLIEKELSKIRDLADWLAKVDPQWLHKDDKKALSELVRGVDDLRETLSQRDIDQALKMAGKLLEGIKELDRELKTGIDKVVEQEGDGPKAQGRRRAQRRLAGARPKAREIVKDLEKMMPRPDELLDRGERSRLDRLAERQKRTTERLDRVRRLAQKLDEESPGAGSRIMRDLDGAKEAMKGATGKLEARESGPANHLAREALRRLEAARQGLEKQSGKPGKAGDGPGGGVTRRRVAIPDAERYNVPKEYRDQLLKALRERAPRRYRRLIEQYYEELIQ